MGWLQRFMMGRYGVDQFSVALLVISLIMSFGLRFVPVPGVYLVTYLPLGYCIFRMLSRNISSRRAENNWFLRVWNPIVRWFRNTHQRFKDRKFHRYFRCPECKTTVRVPKGKGKIQITCPKCRHEFIKKT